MTDTTTLQEARTRAHTILGRLAAAVREQNWFAGILAATFGLCEQIEAELIR